MEEALVCSEIRILTCSIYVFLISHEPFYVVWTFYEQKSNSLQEMMFLRRKTLFFHEKGLL